LRYNVVLTAAAAEDFRRLDGSLKEVAKQLRKLETAPRLGEHLGNRAGLDLTGYFKL
jgi:mRNA interferase RelE/StbE